MPADNSFFVCLFLDHTELCSWLTACSILRDHSSGAQGICNPRNYNGICNFSPLQGKCPTQWRISLTSYGLLLQIKLK